MNTRTFYKTINTEIFVLIVIQIGLRFKCWVNNIKNRYGYHTCLQNACVFVLFKLTDKIENGQI